MHNTQEGFCQSFSKNAGLVSTCRSLSCCFWCRTCVLQAMSGSEQDWLSLRPREPSPSQCCGGGCKPCIYDVYEKELAQWERAKAKQDKSLLTEKREQVDLPPSHPGACALMSSNSVLNPDTFTAFSVSSVEQLTEDTYQYKFELPGNSSLQLSLGQHIVLRGVVNGLEVQRAYTPISPGNAEGYFEVLIKCYEAGLMSQYIKTWKKGDMVFWRGPFGGFPYQPNKETSLEKLPWSYQENTYTGRLNEDLMKTIINSCRRRPFVLICGSSAFNEDMTRYLKAAGIEENSCFVF
ncbi:PREDICTED: NADH-cytochrome b5 reductase-like isoform X6 [Lepidothrix coronata]|uniref:NADH-cytochrome b5 reductase-like n=1 Tax=Lepidothrix coronata TaxID=321398 RepID=A0A6J0GH20_9PASS|nr:PREDICTED: NADH-cytochrome b5 reductase-like isoform X6 [Lepidothrix coronata]